MGKKKANIELLNMSNRLKQIKQYFGYKRDQMSNLLGISPITYTRNEQGNQMLATRSLMALHTQLGVSLEWFLFGRGSMFWKEVEDMLPPELSEMVTLMNKIPLLHHSIMLHFQELKAQHATLIQKALEPGASESST